MIDYPRGRLMERGRDRRGRQPGQPPGGLGRRAGPADRHGRDPV